MSTNERAELLRRGWDALVKELGAIDAARFWGEIGAGSGDYTEERREAQASVNHEELWKAIMARQAASAEPHRQAG